MYLLVGLGNPGPNYTRNRHNAGFIAVDAIADAHGFGPERAKYKGALREGKIGLHKVLILKPQTFYNESGNSVAAAARFHKIDPDDIIVFHDEIDLAPGKIRVKKGGGLAGNNGLRSTAAHLGPDFWRVRIGIGHPGPKNAVTAHVLGDFSKSEHTEWLDEMLARMGKAAEKLLPPDIEAAGKFMSGIVQPPAPKPAAKSAAKPEALNPAAAPSKSDLNSAASAKKLDTPISPFAFLRDALKKHDD